MTPTSRLEQSRRDAIKLRIEWYIFLHTPQQRLLMLFDGPNNPPKLPLFMGCSRPLSNAWFFELTWVRPPNGISINSAVFVYSSPVWPTCRLRYVRHLQHRPGPLPFWQHSDVKPRLVFSVSHSADGTLSLSFQPVASWPWTRVFVFNLLICVRCPATFCDWRYLNLDICSSSSSSSSNRPHLCSACDAA